MASGSIKKLLLNRVSFNVAADANLAKTPKVTKEGIPHSGGNSMKETKNPAQVESVTVIVNDLEYQNLESIAALSNIPMSYTKNDGSVWSTPGDISIDNYESEENRCDVMLIPSDGDNWKLAAAGS